MAPYAYFKKKFLPLAEANTNILTHSFHYGTACFEGIRGNWNAAKGQMYIFRLEDHYKRLLDGCRILKMQPKYSLKEMCDLTVELVRKSGYREDVYIRPMHHTSSELLGVRLHNVESDLLIIVSTLAAYLGTNEGVRCCVSSWRRVDDTMIPARGKITGIYVNSALAKTEAIEHGFDEAIMLTQDGHVSEGTGENIFFVEDGKLITPPTTDNILMGITRDSIIQLAKKELGITCEERSIDRSELFLADEVFFTGTAAHVAAVINVDHRPIADGKAGPITTKLQKLYFDIIYGKNQKYAKWLTPVLPGKKAAAKTPEK
jgi:branched-chain amino acid aminotransferase